MKQEFLNNEFEIEGYYPYLEKTRVQLATKVEIIDVVKGFRQNRPVFIGRFPFGVYKFDFCVEEMLRFLERFGKVPQQWIGLKFELKANPITINRKNALRLTFRPIE